MLSKAVAEVIAAGLGDLFPAWRITVIQWGDGSYRYEARADDLSLPVVALITDDAGRLWRALRAIR